MGKLLKFIVPVVLIFFAFNFNPLLGLVVLLGCIGYTVYTSLPSVYIMLGQKNYPADVQKTFSYLEKAHKTGRMSKDNVIYYSYMCLREGRLEKAERLINSILAFKVDADTKMKAKSNQALLFWKQGNIDEALEILEEIFKTYKTTSLYGTLGYLLIEKGDYEKSLAFNLEAYEFNDSNNVILDNLGQNYCILGKYEKAAEVYEKLWETAKPDFPVPFYNYALVKHNLGETEDAVELLREGLGKRFTFLAAVSKEEMENKLNEFEEIINNQ